MHKLIFMVLFTLALITFVTVNVQPTQKLTPDQTKELYRSK